MVEAASTKPRKLAVVIFNLGGPDTPEAIRPFLLNLFSDPAILRMPNPFRWVAARVITARRAATSEEIYSKVGGGSALLPATVEQAEALKKEIADTAEQVEVFVFMRYWHPLVSETVRSIKDFGPDRIVLLPLYPQFSTTTTGTSVKAFREAAHRQGLSAPQDVVCCYPAHHGFLGATVANIRKSLDEASRHGAPRLLLSAHALPQRTINAGDPYQWQVEMTSAAIVEALDRTGLDWATCYQSRVGPVQWIGPSTESEVRRAGAAGVPVVVVPIAFVSEHVETLVEIDMELREIAADTGVPFFTRCPTVAVDCDFIRGLGDLVRGAIGRDGVASDIGPRRCPMQFGTCPNTTGLH
ncbi:MAG: ferrochelatase [Gammaproteobacteria bacterium]|nr:ferrochelatase [Gammaproteobacteria bacterium]MYF58113.1 ferrochelatase [Gammaproteobacteria bacterium]